MIFWIGFFVMFFNEGFVMMRHISPWCARQRNKFIKRYGENTWYRFHGTLDYTWIGLVTIGLIVNSNRILHVMALLTFWTVSFMVFYLPRWIRK